MDHIDYAMLCELLPSLVMLDVIIELIIDFSKRALLILL